ncbi:MAG: sigma 54-interacting transcriptional regulator [Bryobacteraceae bacterium]
MLSASPSSGSDLQPQQKLQALLSICQLMNSERDLGRLLDLVARESTRLLECDRASIFLYDAGKRELWSQVALGSEEILRFDSTKGVAGAALSTGSTINVADAYRDSRFNKAIDDRTGYHTSNLLATPLRLSSGETVGVFEVLNKQDGVFGAEDEEILRSLAAQAAIAIQNARLIGELRKKRDELTEENTILWREVSGKFSQPQLLGGSARIQNVLRLVERIRDTSVNVLIGGESGTGKELVARTIHYTSLRARKPFVALNCAALPDTLVEAELFGIEKGVATGVEKRIGLFQSAHGGTLFLDEIGDLSLSAQAKILRVLQERVVERVGGRTGIPVDVRVLSATNKDLEREIREGRFREDLLYRLRVVQIEMPALRDIREDIPLLAKHFVAECCREQNRPLLDISPEVVRRLCEQPWPGNVRQLQNEIRRLVAFARGNGITEEDLFEGLPGAPAATAGSPARPKTIPEAIEEVERRLIADTLASTGNNQLRAAKILGLSRQGLINKMKRYQLA